MKANKDRKWSNQFSSDCTRSGHYIQLGFCNRPISNTAPWHRNNPELGISSVFQSPHATRLPPSSPTSLSLSITSRMFTQIERFTYLEFLMHSKMIRRTSEVTKAGG